MHRCYEHVNLDKLENRFPFHIYVHYNRHSLAHSPGFFVHANWDSAADFHALSCQILTLEYWQLPEWPNTWYHTNYIWILTLCWEMRLGTGCQIHNSWNFVVYFHFKFLESYFFARLIKTQKPTLHEQEVKVCHKISANVNNRLAEKRLWRVWIVGIIDAAKTRPKLGAFLAYPFICIFRLDFVVYEVEVRHMHKQKNTHLATAFLCASRRTM